ncbi:MAG: alanyl-tRNA editing protein [Nitrososphaerota archaeon]|nr:alanyl-tRNA editing protein [Candidatus Calditenuis fumarioli]
MVRLEEVAEGCPETTRLYLEDAYLREVEAEVIRYVPETKKSGYLVLDATIFHPKGGGQPSDTGEVVASDGSRFRVRKVLEAGPVVVHYGQVVQGDPPTGRVRLLLDWEPRYQVMRYHTAGHVLDHAVLSVVGGDLRSASAFHGPPEGYIEFEGELGAVDPRALEAEANRVVGEDRRVYAIWVGKEELPGKVKGAFNLSRLPDLPRYRVVVIEGINAIPCGGTHVSRTGEVGKVRVTGIDVSGGLSRVRYRVE